MQQLMGAALAPAEGEALRQPTLDPVPEGTDVPQMSAAETPPSSQGLLAPQLSLDKLALTEAAQDVSGMDFTAERFSVPEVSTPVQQPSTALPKVASVDLMPRTGRLLVDMRAAANREVLSEEPPATRATGRASRPPADGPAAVPSRLSMVSRAAEVSSGMEQPAGGVPAADSRGEALAPLLELQDGPEPAAACSVAADSPHAASGLPLLVAKQHQVLHT